MLFNDAKDIISGAYYELGDITLKLANYFDNGYGKSDAFKKLVKKGILIDSELEYLFEHVVYNTDGTIQQVIRSTDIQINKSLRYLTDISGIKNIAAVPVFRKRYILRSPVSGSSSSGGSVAGGLIYKGGWAGATNVLPTGAIEAGWCWRVTSNTTTLLGPDGGIIPSGMMLLALIDNPGADPSDTTKWLILSGIGI
jgi:hypothetical protein